MNTDISVRQASTPQDSTQATGTAQATDAKQVASDSKSQATSNSDTAASGGTSSTVIDATKPVPPANMIDLKVDGSDAAKKAAEEREMQAQQRQQELDRIAQTNTLDPNKKTTDNIMGQTAGGLDQLAQNNPAEMPAPDQQVAGNAQNQAQPVKKKPWYKFW